MFLLLYCIVLYSLFQSRVISHVTSNIFRKSAILVDLRTVTVQVVKTENKNNHGRVYRLRRNLINCLEGNVSSLFWLLIEDFNKMA